MNRALKRISIAVLVMFLALLVNLNYLQGFQTASLSSRPDNIRGLEGSYQYERGDILTSDGVKIAGTVPSADFYNYKRVYNHAPVYAPVTGYDTLYSQTGVEQAENGLLSGNSDQLSFRNFIDMLTNKPRKGATVELTINSKIQQAAYDGLQTVLNHTKNTGAVVAINPKTGAILAMASWPSYDTNLLAVHHGDELNANDHQLLTQQPSPLLNYATQAVYPPGSTFKIVTTSTWLTQNSANTPQTVLSSPQPLRLPNGNFLSNDAGEKCGDGSGHTPAIIAFAMSCNTPFAQLGIDLGGTALKSMADGFGFNQPLDIPGVTAVQSNFTAEPDKSLTAFDAIGQHDTTETPLEEAMAAATIANNGTLMRPYLVQQVIASDLSIVSQTTPAVLSRPITPAVAGNEKQMMVAVVDDGNGTAHQVVINNGATNLQIAGKTGTAQTSSGSQPDSVFTAFAPADNPQIAVGVIVQGGGYGATTAAPIAIAAIKAALG